ncbi:hypothetical protein [Arthrobacter sp. ERGS1:01]|uniref:hypothetical protein n=1 Tax=Arthrobacter sp. ERGS1:01 TaxID=1704044 RepID=UPI000AD61C32|nr:hypothetical protein [Arthrobacter sp. ERGS1:01]
MPSDDEAAPKEASIRAAFEPPRTPELCPLAGFFAHRGATEVAGISLVHMAGQESVAAGDLITFTAWILNATAEALTDVTLHLHSFTNEHGDQLGYRTEPPASEMIGRTLGPRQALKYHFSYVATERDVEEPGLLISALKANLVTPRQGRLFSECDALVSVAVSGAQPLTFQHS